MSTPVELVIQLTTLQTRMQKRLSGALSAHGLSFTEYLVLRQLAAAADHRLRRIDLAEHVGLSASGVTRLLNPMEKTGLVRKEENARDARVSLVALSKAGQRLYQDADVAVAHAAQALFSGLSEDHVQSLSGVLKTLRIP
ncbi:MarR family transcriptional regulator [Oleiagrimonas sp. C23AA]|uniref:MarR family winged helix-turn-helix transcriptional regulator n=1 Tax=Oleiagrimonas sp. C23AA TaxID=2719047 RepID=UPI00141D7A53|nr:MarR family transcriptional regulator [Oleiagrimonas sp. C23AA]NII11067.1 MarR family transcriptional regulator [Oleiagrimonas sp. C23AA]